MEININVGGAITRVLPPKAGQRGLVQVGLVLKSTLNVIGVDEDVDKIIMNQCCYEQKTISMDSSQGVDMDYVQEVLNGTFLQNMHTNLEPEDGTVCLRVARIITELVESAKRSNPSFGIVLLEVRVDCLTDRPSNGPDGPDGEHGYNRLLQRRSEACAICRHNFNVLKDVVVTACQHAFHRACIFRRLHSTSRFCPVCQFHLAPMIGSGQIRFKY